MQRILLMACVCLVAYAVAGCSSGMSVQSDWDDNAEFSRFKTFQVLESQTVADPLIARRISDAVRVHLTERAFTEDTENPDFLVAVHTDVQVRVDVQTWGYSASSRHWHGGRDVTVTNYQEGTLLIDFVDAENKELFWRGWGTQRLSSSSREPHVIQDAIDRLLGQYPPE